MHPDSEPWTFPGSALSTGAGACASTTLAAVLDEIRQGFPDVRDITTLKPAGPAGITRIAGPAVREGTSPPPATGTASYIVALSDERSWGAIFFRGAGCSGEMCQVRDYWFFETGDGCRALWVGHNRAVDRHGGAHGDCVDFQGASVWQTPGNPDPRRRCDADWSPQDISGTRQVVSLDPFGGCGRVDQAAAVNALPIGLSITQGADRGRADLSLTDTGIPFIEGRSFAGKVERQSFTSTIDETVAGDCPIHRRIDIHLDFEEPTSVGLPGGIGLVEVLQEVATGCSSVAASCSSWMHLVKGSTFP